MGEIVSGLRRRRAGTKSRRRGTATVELAVCLPVLLIFAFASIEVCNVMHLRQRLVTVSFEGVRLATRPTISTRQAATAGEVTARCQALLSQLGVQGGSVTLSPASMVGITSQTPVTVTVSAPLSGNSMTSFVIGTSFTVTGRSTMVFE